MPYHGANITRTIAASLLAALILAAGDATAQSQQSAPSPSPRASDSPSPVNTVEGTVRKVDPVGGTLQVSSGLFGLFGTTLQVNPDTRIQTEGRPTGLGDIREGDKVKASYELREGQGIARVIQVTPAQEPPRGLTPRPPASSGSPQPSR